MVVETGESRWRIPGVLWQGSCQALVQIKVVGFGGFVQPDDGRIISPVLSAGACMRKARRSVVALAALLRASRLQVCLGIGLTNSILPTADGQVGRSTSNVVLLRRWRPGPSAPPLRGLNTAAGYWIAGAHMYQGAVGGRGCCGKTDKHLAWHAWSLGRA